MKRSLLIVYVAAALSFGAGLVRDWMVVHHVLASKEFFGVMYAIAFASSFAVNEVSFRAGHSVFRAREFGVVAASSALCVLLLWTSGIRESAVILLSAPIPALYIFGASMSRSLIDRGALFLARSRDGLTSIAMVVCIASGLQLGALPIATLVVTAFFAYGAVARRGTDSWDNGPGRALIVRTEGGRREWLRSMIYSNLAISTITLWALFTNNHGAAAFDQPASIVVRFSLYAFQILSIPAVLVVRLHVPKESAGPLLAGTWFCAACLVGSMLLPLALACVAVPLTAIATMYASLLYLRADHLRRVVA
jgi:hypothetical protein